MNLVCLSLHPYNLGIPLTLHRRQFFPSDYFQKDGYCPKVWGEEEEEEEAQARPRLESTTRLSTLNPLISCEKDITTVSALST